MKDGWEYKKLGEVCEPKKNILRAKTQYVANEIIQYVDISSIDNDAKKIGNMISFEYSKAPSRAQQCVVEGDVLYSLVRPNLQNIAILPHTDKNNIVASSGFCVLRNTANSLSRFLYYLLLSNNFTTYILGLVSGANYPAVREDDVKKFMFNFPPLSEQHAIVEELDLLNEIIDKKKAELEELDKLAQSIFYDMFGDPVENDKGWEVKKLGELVELKNGLNFTPKDNGNCVRIIGVADFKDLNVVRNVRLIGFKSIEGEVAPDYYLQDGDILIVRSNGSKELVGRNLMIYTNGELVTYSGFCIRCRIQNMGKLSSVYLNAFLSKREIRKILRQEGRGANISNINQKILSSQIVPLPPLPLQQQFASRISALEKMKEKVTESMTETQTLLAATMDKYFG